MESIGKITEYIRTCTGLEEECGSKTYLKVQQKIDGKTIIIDKESIEDVLDRVDADGKAFIQVNYQSGLKLLLTEQLIGFKPVPHRDLDMSKLPNVVTTPDLFSVFEAIQEALSEDCGDEDVETLKRVFEAVIQGGEAIGFDLSEERAWLQRLTTATLRASA